MVYGNWKVVFGPGPSFEVFKCEVFEVYKQKLVSAPIFPFVLMHGALINCSSQFSVPKWKKKQVAANQDYFFKKFSM